MNTHPAADLSHPDHLDYFAKIVSENLSRTPSVSPHAFIAPGAFLMGAVTVEAGGNIWPGASLRGDIAPAAMRDSVTLAGRAHRPRLFGIAQ